MEKPIFFNTEMVKAILGDRKTITRRIIKNVSGLDFLGTSSEDGSKFDSALFGKENLDEILDSEIKERIKAPYLPGDILYVRETWLNADDGYHYKANATFTSEEVRKEYGYKWKSLIYMPKVAARIFLKVINVKVERIRDITEEGAKVEGAVEQIWYQPYGTKSESNQKYVGDLAHHQANYITGFADIWDRTLRKPNGWMYSFRENPWVWAIEFEKIK